MKKTVIFDSLVYFYKLLSVEFRALQELYQKLVVGTILAIDIVYYYC